MAAPKKRKVKLDDDGDDDLMAGWYELENDFGSDVVDTPVKKPVKRRRAPKKKKVPIKIPREDLWAKLPGELRNKIYELVLPVPGTVEIRSRKKPTNHDRRLLEPAKTMRWMEPALMQVSQQLRAECRSLYYGNNHFTIFARSEELGKVLDFLLVKSADEGIDITLSFDIQMVNAKWTDMKNWFAMAEIAWHAGGDPERNEDRIADVWWTRSGYVDGAIHDMEKLGRKVRQRGLEWEHLREDFGDWAETVLKLFRRSGGWLKGANGEDMAVFTGGTNVLGPY